MMKVNDFISKLEKAEKEKSLYKLGTFLNKKRGIYRLSDCSGLIKGILWGYPENGKYQSNGVPDINANTMISKYCSEVSNNFSTIKKGELVWMSGHIGVYIGDGVVIESSPKWENGIQRTYCNGCGISNKYGLNSRTWKKHGKFKYLDYSNENKKTIHEIALEVINGKYGNGHDNRRRQIEELGYNYEEVRAEVNRILLS